MREDAAIAAYLQHLQVERQLSAHTLDAYRRDLDALLHWAMQQPDAADLTACFLHAVAHIEQQRAGAAGEIQNAAQRAARAR